MIRAVVFDFDGLILDTETNEFRSYQAVFTAFRAELKLAEWQKWIGTDASSFDVYGLLARQAGDGFDLEEARRMRRERFAQFMRDERVRPGVETYLRRARELGLKIGLASSSSRAWLMGYLEPLGLAGFFDTIRAKDDVEKVKPDPALYLLALRDLGVSPGQAAAFEDSPNGSEAARRAGMFCVAVPNALTADLAFPHADLKLASMEAMSLDEVLRLLSARQTDG